MPGRHRPGAHNAKKIAVRDYFNVLPVKAPVQPPKEKPSKPVKGTKLTPSDTDKA